jgi:carbohydrate-binding DOMON domain-containing protein
MASNTTTTLTTTLTSTLLPTPTTTTNTVTITNLVTLVSTITPTPVWMESASVRVGNVPATMDPWKIGLISAAGIVVCAMVAGFFVYKHKKKTSPPVRQVTRQQSYDAAVLRLQQW